jgi:cobalt-precorrin-6B (C15)-methyltransferase
LSDLLYISGGPTKPEVISVSLSKLDLHDGDTFVDLGCGTGAVSIEASKMRQGLKIYAIDSRSEAIDTAAQNFETYQLQDVDLIHGESSKVLTENADIDSIDSAFIGGTKNINQVLEILVDKGVKNLVINAVRMETVVKAMQKMRDMDIFDEVLHLSVSHGTPIAGETMFKPDNPVYIIVGKSQSRLNQ